MPYNWLHDADEGPREGWTGWLVEPARPGLDTLKMKLMMMKNFKLYYFSLVAR